MKAVPQSVVRLVSAMPKDRPVGTWFLVEAVLGAAAAEALGPKKARHFCERYISYAERHGYIRRLPSRIRSTVPNHHRSGAFSRRIDKEIAWVLNDEPRSAVISPGAEKAPCPDEYAKGAEHVRVNVHVTEEQQ